MKRHEVAAFLIFGLISVCCSHMITPVSFADEALFDHPNQPGHGREILLSANNETAESFEDDDFDFLDDEAGNAPVVNRVADPLEPWNRAMFTFNDKCYFWVLKPVAKGYKAVVPKFFRECFRNFFNNVSTPIRLANCILQAKVDASFSEFGRFVTNTTVGVLGFGNPARDYPALNPDEEDFGQTLGRYGIGHGVYIVWPLFGPSSIRDTVGSAGDYFLKPTTYIDSWVASAAISTGDKINRTSLQIGQYETFKAGAFEPYVAARNAYIQYREGKVEK